MKKMKKITLLTAIAFISKMAFGQSFFVPTTYRGAFAPAPEAQWTDNWTNWDPQNTTSYGTSHVNVTASITTNTTWTSNNVYLLQGQIYVKNGATLTIQPGTVIMGDKNTPGSGLFITQGSKLIADGTTSNPIVFTSNQPAGSRAKGDWGGVILLGRATTNSPGGIANIEGLAVSPDTQYGGGASPDDNDNSGILRNVRIEFGGYVYVQDKEINGLTMGAVGKGTIIERVQVSFANDDAFEWFGGTVNCRYLVSYRNLDDDFDTDNGFSGKVQFCLAVRDPNIADNPSVSTSEGFESDNNAAGDGSTPQTSGIFSNVTHIGPLRGNTAATVASGYRRGARLRRNTALKIYNAIFMDDLRGIHIDGTSCETNANNGTLKYKNNVVAGFQTGKSVERNTGSTFNVSAWFGTNNNDSLTSSANILTDPYGANYLTPDFRPVSGSVALTNYSFSDNDILSFIIPAPQTTTSFNYCVGQSANTLSATGNSDCTIKWYTSSSGGVPISAPTPNTSTAGTSIYYVAQQNALGYEGPRVAVTITVNALPSTPTISANGPTSFCTGGNVVLTSSSSTGNTWSTNATTQAITVTSSGSYTVIVTDNNGCTATSTATNVNVSNTPIPTISASASQACSGDTVVLTSSQADSYAWSNGATSQSINVVISGSYTVTTTNAIACNGVGTSDPIVITISQTPVAQGSFTASGNVVNFSNTSSGANSYSWDFGDFTNSSSNTPTHAYAANGNYNVILTAINGSCTDTATFSIAISVSIEELMGISELTIFPVPASEYINISFNNNNNNAIEIEMIDELGRLISSSTNSNGGFNTTEINLNNVLNGLYIIRLTSDGKSVSRKVIVNK